MQAALALLPRDAVVAVYGSSPTTEQGRRYAQYAQDVLTTAVFCILICGSIGTLLIRIFAPVLLQKVTDAQRLSPGQNHLEYPVL